MASSRYLLHATAKFGTQSMDGITRAKPVICPVPGCGKLVSTTQSGFLCEHVNKYGYTCDGVVSFSPQKAARLQIDAQGRLLDVDEMATEATNDA